MKCNEDIYETLEKTILLLKNNGEKNWAKSLERCQKELNNDSVYVCNKILSMYGGMGSFNDIVLYKDGQPLMKENELLDDLKTDLYHMCKNI
ncbi:DUF6966 domain-containing protein [Neptuniibacter sp. PT34_22]|uniref:DUF6966 domain-containing protein n=1 Tax=Neptuniibacter sp. PT34_22 TaxID=3398205 RepID=UPI0039F4FD94